MEGSGLNSGVVPRRFHHPRAAGRVMACPLASLQVEPQIRFYQTRVPRYYSRKTVVELLLVIGALAGTIMAFLGIDQWTARPSLQASTINRILGRRTAPFSPFLIPNRAPHGVTPRS